MAFVGSNPAASTIWYGRIQVVKGGFHSRELSKPTNNAPLAQSVEHETFMPQT